MSIATPVFLPSQKVTEGLWTPLLTPETLSVLMRVRAMNPYSIKDKRYSVDKIFVRGSKGRLHVYPCKTEGMAYELREYKGEEEFRVIKEISRESFFETYQGEIHVQGEHMITLLDIAVDLWHDVPCNIQVITCQELISELTAWKDIAPDTALSISQCGHESITYVRGCLKLRDGVILIHLPQWNRFRKYRKSAISRLGEDLYKSTVDILSFAETKIPAGTTALNKRLRKVVTIPTDVVCEKPTTEVHYLYEKGGQIIMGSDPIFNLLIKEDK